jgi:tRNA U55 pseudouridine synthase TruB
LRRTRSGPFSIDAALPLTEVEVLLKQRRLNQHLIPLAQAMGFLPVMEVGETAALQISHGQVISLKGVDQGAQQEVPQGVPQGGRKEERKEGEVVRVVAKKEGGLVAVAEIRQGEGGLVVRPLRVFHDAFTKRPPYGKNKDSTMVDQGGR